MFTEYSVGQTDPVFWAVANTAPNKEALAREGLERQDFNVYCPMIRKRVRHARQVRDVLRPLFPGYLFVQVPRERHRWRPIDSTTGVRRLVKSGDTPGLIDDTFVRALRAREIDGAIVKPTVPYGIGQSIRITSGALEGQIATIIEMNERDRLLILMQLLNRPVKVHVFASDVTAA